MRRLLLAAILGVGLGAGVAWSQTPDDDAAADPSDLVNALLAGLLPTGSLTPEGLQAEVAEVGGLPFRQDVPIAFMSRPELAAYLREVFDAEYPAERARADERLLAALDLLPPGADLRALRARLLQDNVVGFYDERPGRRRLYAVSPDRSLTPMNQIILAHELRHAQQDQYEDLHTKLPAEISDFDDRRVAFMALLEGDATLVMERFLLRRLGAEAAGGEPTMGLLDLAGAASVSSLDLPGAPPVLRDLLLQPYVAGHAFAQALWQRGGAEEIRKAWVDPPQTTEQVLHPERFFAGEARRGVDVGLGPRRGRLLSEGVFGELLIRTLLEGDEPAAAGWGGDAWRLWDVGGRTLLRWVSVWDTPEDLVAFGAALEGRFARQHRAEADAAGGWRRFTDGRWSFAIRTSAQVEMVSTDDPELLSAALGLPLGGDEPRPAQALDTAGEDATVHPAAGDLGSAAIGRSDDPALGGAMTTPASGGGKTNLGIQPNLGGLLCYVPCCIGLVFSVVAAIVEKQSRFVRFHAFQSLLVHGVGLVVLIAIQFAQVVLGVMGLGAVAALFWVLGAVVGVALLVAFVLLMIKANAGEELELPVVGELARRWA